MNAADRLKNETGGALFLVILLLAMLSIIGITASNTGILELQMATNHQDHKISFFIADSGMDITPRVVDSVFDELKYDETNSAGFRIAPVYDDEIGFKGEILGQDRDQDTKEGIRYPLSGYTVHARVNFDDPPRHAAGSDVEKFVTYLYEIESEGNGPHNAISRLSGTSKYVNRLPGR